MKRERIQKVTHTRAETLRLARRFSRCLEAGDVVALYGELGSGKTVFAQGVCAGLDVEDPVTSPTFTLVQEYRGRMTVFHIDFYRLDSCEEIVHLDLDGILDSGGVTLIEWAERGEALLPEERFSVFLHYPAPKRGTGEGCREIRMEGPSGRGLAEI